MPVLKRRNEEMPALGPMELLIILTIIIVLFGASRLAGIGGALGNSVREFRKTVKDDAVPPRSTRSIDQNRA